MWMQEGLVERESMRRGARRELLPTVIQREIHLDGRVRHCQATTLRTPSHLTSERWKSKRGVAAGEVVRVAVVMLVLVC